MARDFDGTSGYLSLLDGDVYYLPTAWSLALWVNFDAIGGNTALVNHALPANGNIPITLALGNGGAEAGVNIMYTGFYNGGWRVARWAIPPTGQWLHCVGVWDGTNILLYVNGKLVGGNSGGSGTPAAPNAGTDFYIGRNWNGTPYLDGRMNDIAIWDKALSYKQISALAKGVSPLSELPGSLVSYWPMSGEPIERDMSPRQKHLAASGTTAPAYGSMEEIPFNRIPLLPPMYPPVQPTIVGVQMFLEGIVSG